MKDFAAAAIGTLLGVGLRTLIRPAPNTRAKARR